MISMILHWPDEGSMGFVGECGRTGKKFETFRGCQALSDKFADRFQTVGGASLRRIKNHLARLNHTLAPGIADALDGGPGSCRGWWADGVGRTMNHEVASFAQVQIFEVI
jgi:hypothetical protein